MDASDDPDGPDDPDGSAAFVPGHVTAFFSVHRDDDPAAAGSRGAGVALSDGVEVRVETDADDDVGADERGDASDGADPAAAAVVLNGERTTVEPVAHVLDGLDASGARVRAETPLPVGAGFGVSGAVALGAALAGNAATGGARSEDDLVELAHVAEVTAGTGLGDVVAQARGGVPVRLDPGAPGVGRLDGVPAAGRVEYVTFGGLSTADVVGGDVEALTAAGERALADLRARPTPTRLMALGRRFAREADLLVPAVAEALAAVDDVGGRGAMAMLGRSAFALGTGLSDAGYDPRVCRIHHAGAHLLWDDGPADGGRG